MFFLEWYLHMYSYFATQPIVTKKLLMHSSIKENLDLRLDLRYILHTDNMLSLRKLLIKDRKKFIFSCESFLGYPFMRAEIIKKPHYTVHTFLASILARVRWAGMWAGLACNACWNQCSASSSRPAFWNIYTCFIYFAIYLFPFDTALSIKKRSFYIRL